MSRQPWSAWIIGACLWAMSAAGTWAQTNDEINAGLQFDFSPPGARSLAMGNAFVGLADDATAAYANPAGLMWLTRPEVSLEVRNRQDIHRYPDRGSASGTVSGLGLDVDEQLVFSEQESANTGLAYLSYVAVPSDRWRVAVYRHELARFDARIESQGPFIRAGSTRSRLAAVRADLELNLVNLGISFAYAVNDNFWLGLGASFYALHLDGTTHRYLTVNLQGGSSRAVFDPVALVAANERDRHLQHSDDDAVAGILGMLWRSPSKRWSLGLVYRQSPEFDMEYRYEWGRRTIALAVGDSDGDGILDQDPNLNWTDPGIEDVLSGETIFKVPEMVSLGAAWRPSSTLTLSMEVNRVQYSDLEPKANILVSGLDRPESCGDFDPDGNPQPREVCVVAPRRFDRFSVPDTTEVHLGVEYVLGSRRPWALRFGAWNEPDHHMVFESPDGAAAAPPDDRFVARFQPGDDQIHWTFGFGLVLDRLQVDFGVDLSDQRDVAGLSAIYRF